MTLWFLVVKLPDEDTFRDEKPDIERMFSSTVLGFYGARVKWQWNLDAERFYAWTALDATVFRELVKKQIEYLRTKRMRTQFILFGQLIEEGTLGLK